jgi:hypothetical protein
LRGIKPYKTISFAENDGEMGKLRDVVFWEEGGRKRVLLVLVY